MRVSPFGTKSRRGFIFTEMNTLTSTTGKSASIIAEAKLKRHLNNLHAAESKSRGRNAPCTHEKPLSDVIVILGATNVDDITKLKSVIASRTPSFVVEGLKILIHLIHNGSLAAF